jgi:hypothetical protein
MQSKQTDKETQGGSYRDKLDNVQSATGGALQGWECIGGYTRKPEERKAELPDFFQDSGR